LLNCSDTNVRYICSMYIETQDFYIIKKRERERERERVSSLSYFKENIDLGFLN